MNRYNWTLWYFAFAVLVGVGLWLGKLAGFDWLCSGC